MLKQEQFTTLERKIERFGRILEEKPGDGLTVLAMAEASFRRGLKLEALTAYQTVTNEQPVPEAHLAVAEIYSQQNMTVEAYGELRELFKLDPENVEARLLAQQLQEQALPPEDIAAVLNYPTTDEAFEEAKLRLQIQRTIHNRELQERTRNVTLEPGVVIHEYYVEEAKKKLIEVDEQLRKLGELKLFNATLSTTPPPTPTPTPVQPMDEQPVVEDGAVAEVPVAAAEPAAIGDEGIAAPASPDEMMAAEPAQMIPQATEPSGEADSPIELVTTPEANLTPDMPEPSLMPEVAVEPAEDVMAPTADISPEALDVGGTADFQTMEPEPIMVSPETNDSPSMELQEPAQIPVDSPEAPPIEVTPEPQDTETAPIEISAEPQADTAIEPGLVSAPELETPTTELVQPEPDQGFMPPSAESAPEELAVAPVLEEPAPDADSGMSTIAIDPIGVEPELPGPEELSFDPTGSGELPAMPEPTPVAPAELELSAPLGESGESNPAIELESLTPELPGDPEPAPTSPDNSFEIDFSVDVDNPVAPDLPTGQEVSTPEPLPIQTGAEVEPVDYIQEAPPEPEPIPVDVPAVPEQPEELTSIPTVVTTPEAAAPAPEPVPEPPAPEPPAPAPAASPEVTAAERQAFYESKAEELGKLTGTLARTRGVTSIFLVARDGTTIDSVVKDNISEERVGELVQESFEFLLAYAKSPSYWVLECTGGIFVMQTLDEDHVLIAIGQAGANFGALRYTMDKTKTKFGAILQDVPR